MNKVETRWATDVIRSLRGLEAYCRRHAGGPGGGSGRAKTVAAGTGPYEMGEVAVGFVGIDKN